MTSETSVSQRVEMARRSLKGVASRKYRSQMGQFFTPASIACFMASLFEKPCRNARILDPGAGIGALFAALVQGFLLRNAPPRSIEVVAYETDKHLSPHIEQTMRSCARACDDRGVAFDGQVLCRDFVSEALALTDDGLFRSDELLFTHAILNPPYKKINGDSTARKLLRSAGMETSNLYSAFVWLACRLLEHGGELVAITPRSFCNGPYFRRFRKALLGLVGLHRLHLFESRKEAFRDDSVLQENVILHGVRGEPQPGHIIISTSRGSGLSQTRETLVPIERVLFPGDPDAFIHVTDDEEDSDTAKRMEALRTSLDQLELEVSTGRVVDFRARGFLREKPGSGAAPLLYPCHFSDGFTQWPILGGKKPNAIAVTEKTHRLLVASGHYVLTKRFSAKEEPRRVVAAVCDPKRFESEWLAFENHLNYFHAQGRGMSPGLAKGLAVFLNSTLLDRHFRSFSGHTQVNATDLRKIRYPSRDQLLALGRHVRDRMPDQQTIDRLLEKECALTVTKISGKSSRSVKWNSTATSGTSSETSGTSPDPRPHHAVGAPRRQLKGGSSASA